MSALVACTIAVADARAETYWGNQGTRCEGTRRIDYARLWGLTWGTDWVAICQDTVAVGVSERADGKRPSSCVQKVDSSVWAEWRFSNHASCTTASPDLRWGNVGQKCEGPHRVDFARLWGLQPGTDWKGICERTTALNVSPLSDGKVPSMCIDKGAVEGTWGEWRYSNHPSCAARWGEMKRDHCVARGRRQWSARLWDAQPGQEVAACRGTAGTIAGRTYPAPSRCHDLGLGGVWGEFDVADDSCPYWGNELRTAGIVRGDCAAVDVRKDYARLWDVTDGDDWSAACHAELAQVGGRLVGPSSCIDKGPLGMWGEWLVEDRTCTIDRLPQDARREAIARGMLGELAEQVYTRAVFATRLGQDQSVMYQVQNGDADAIARSVSSAGLEGAEPDDSFRFRTLTVGLMAEGKLIIGVSGDAGAAIDLAGQRPVYAYGTVGYNVSVAATAGAGLNVGFWVCQNNKIGGDAWGRTFGLDDLIPFVAALPETGTDPADTADLGVTFAVGVWFNYDDEFLGFTLTPGVGWGVDYGSVDFVTTAVDGDETVTCDGRPVD